MLSVVMLALITPSVMAPNFAVVKCLRNQCKTEVNYSNWDVYQPDPSSGPCIAVGTVGTVWAKWLTKPCSETAFAMCQEGDHFKLAIKYIYHRHINNCTNKR
jgi:hypothetical protein